MSSISTLLRGAVLGSPGIDLRLFMNLLTSGALHSTAASSPLQAAPLAKLAEAVVAASTAAGGAVAVQTVIKCLLAVPGSGALAAVAAIKTALMVRSMNLAAMEHAKGKGESTKEEQAGETVQPVQEPTAACIPKSFPKPQGAAAASKSGLQQDLAHKATAKRSRLFWRSSVRPRLTSNRNAGSRSLHSLSRVKAWDLERSLADAKQNDDLLLPSPVPFLQLVNRALKTSKRQFAHARQRLQQASEARRRRRLNAARPQSRLTTARKGRSHRQSRTSRAAGRAWQKMCALYRYFLARVKLMRALLQAVTARTMTAARGPGGATAVALSMSGVKYGCDDGGNGRSGSMTQSSTRPTMQGRARKKRKTMVLKTFKVNAPRETAMAWTAATQIAPERRLTPRLSQAPSYGNASSLP